MDLAQVDPGLFRCVMGRFATGVAVITTVVEGDIHGMTANAFMSASLSPPLCVVSIGKAAACTRTCTLPATTVSRS